MRFHPVKAGRRGFTLIELLVVIAIIAILIGLLVPAVQKVREAAARTQCENNLKQMALAMHMYQDTYHKLPAGWSTNVGAAPSPYWSWSTLILPYIEQGPLYNQLAPAVPPTQGSGGTLALPSNPPAGWVGLVVIPIYQCPSDGSPPLNNNFNNYAKINYVINRWVLGPDGNSNPTRMAVQTITDGSSNTLLIGEREMTFNVAGCQLLRHNNTSASFEGRVGRGLNPQPATGPGPIPNHSPYTTGDEQRLAYSSNHTGGCNFAFADGSVHFLSSGVDADPNNAYTDFPTCGDGNGTCLGFTLQRLQFPNDGLPVTIPNL
jgi:prepilin-type N-terminal cleavage/methylation domain-containing protein/prepilin-type processing-associated H-X9-DG protein